MPKRLSVAQAGEVMAHSSGKKRAASFRPHEDRRDTVWAGPERRFYGHPCNRGLASARPARSPIEQVGGVGSTHSVAPQTA